MVKLENDTGSLEPLIRIEQLSVEFGRHEVLHDIDLVIARDGFDFRAAIQDISAHQLIH